ncbi:hypothetical protein V8F20_004864 [Naviculisporaceae sp. PSN 640]
MADDRRGGGGYPRQDSSEASSYPPPPEDDRRSYYPPPPVAPSNTTSLPPITTYAPPPPPSTYPSDPRYSDPRYSRDRGWAAEPPANPNGYPPPESRYPPPPPAPADRGPYEDRSRPYEDPRQYDDRSRAYERPYPEPYYGGQVGQPEPQRGMPYSYGYSPHAQQHAYQYPPQQQAPPPAPPQAAPRQRTSIACRYCRKRKIRCSGYANTPNGKCTNCDKLRIECIFQPVSSNSSTAFVPVSAVPGGVPAGTPLYGAYGQPLAPASGQSSSAAPPYPAPSSDYPPPPAHSPTTSQYPPLDDRDRDLGRRRPRPADEGHPIRLPPPNPNYPKDDDPRRRSPSSIHSNGTPPTSYHSYPPSGYDQGPPEPAHRTSPGGPPPSHPPPANPMSLSLMITPEASRTRTSGNDYDRNMLGKLDRRNQGN